MRVNLQRVSTEEMQEKYWEDTMKRSPYPYLPTPMGYAYARQDFYFFQARFIMSTSKTSTRFFFFPYINHILEPFNFLNSFAEFKIWFDLYLVWTNICWIRWGTPALLHVMSIMKKRKEGLKNNVQDPITINTMISPVLQ